MVHILYGCFSSDPLTLCFKQQEARGLHSMSALFESAHHPGIFQSTSWLYLRKHSDYTWFYSAYLGATRRLLSLAMTCSRTWRTRVLGVPYRNGTWMGPGLGSRSVEGHKTRWHGLQAYQIDLVDLQGKLDFVIGLGLSNCNRLGLVSCPALSSYIKRGMVHPLVHTIIQPIQRKRQHTYWT
jgi:hypothetical protein